MACWHGEDKGAHVPSSSQQSRQNADDHSPKKHVLSAAAYDELEGLIPNGLEFG